MIKEKYKEINKKIKMIYSAYKNPRVGFFANFMIILTLVYALSPVDLIPDFIPVLGYLDDLIILPILIFICFKLIPDDIEYEEVELKGKWYYALPIIAIWILIICLIVFKWII
ncbi:MAG TPA: DUF1232 domain-containing protein [Anaerovoracaceae bacterium]|nr:DUF1232 domain-containing protein [Anaerovoracaceae bacterium]